MRISSRTGSSSQGSQQTIQFGAYDASGQFNGGGSIRFTTGSSRRALSTTNSSTVLDLTADATAVSALLVSHNASVTESVVVGTFRGLHRAG